MVKSGAVVKLTDVVFENSEALVREFSFVDENASPEFKTPGATGGGKTVPGTISTDCEFEPVSATMDDKSQVGGEGKHEDVPQRQRRREGFDRGIGR